MVNPFYTGSTPIFSPSFRDTNSYIICNYIPDNNALIDLLLERARKSIEQQWLYFGKLYQSYHGTTYHGTTYHGTTYHGTVYHGTVYHCNTIWKYPNNNTLIYQ